MLVFALVAALYLFDLVQYAGLLRRRRGALRRRRTRIATTGRNLQRRSPAAVLQPRRSARRQVRRPWGDTYYHPFLFYLDAVVMTVAPLRSRPSACRGAHRRLLTPLLLYAVARRLIGQRAASAVAALVLALAPTHADPEPAGARLHLPVPFVLGWLWCLMRSFGPRRTMFVDAGGFMLGVGCYSYIASWAVMPICCSVSWCWCGARRSRLAPDRASRRSRLRCPSASRRCGSRFIRRCS